MRQVNKYLVVSGQGEVRVVGREPARLKYDEMAFPLNILIPDGWGQVYGETPIDLTLPEPGEAKVTIGQLDYIIGDN